MRISNLLLNAFVVFKLFWALQDNLKISLFILSLLFYHFFYFRERWFPKMKPLKQTNMVNNYSPRDTEIFSAFLVFQTYWSLCVLFTKKRSALAEQQVVGVFSPLPHGGSLNQVEGFLTASPASPGSCQYSLFLLLCVYFKWQ